MLEKIIIYSRSIIISLYYKIRYSKRIKINIVNSFRGLINIWVDKNSNINIGKFLILLGPTYFKVLNGGKLEIGDKCFFNRNCSITCIGRIKIGNNCTFANNLVMVDHDHNIYSDRTIKPYTVADITIGDNVWIGANVTILKGVNIGSSSVVAAGAVVASDVESGYIYGGVPAKKIKKIEKKEDIVER